MPLSWSSRVAISNVEVTAGSILRPHFYLYRRERYGHGHRRLGVESGRLGLMLVLGGLARSGRPALVEHGSGCDRMCGGACTHDVNWIIAAVVVQGFCGATLPDMASAYDDWFLS